MRVAIAALAAVLVTPVFLSAQVRSSGARPVPAELRPSDAKLACELSAGDNLTLAFASCPTPPASAAAKEVETVEYRNGDSPVRVARVTVGGVVRRDLEARRLAWGDPDDDGDGMPREAGRRPGRTKFGNMTLERTRSAGTDTTGVPWEDEDTDGDGFPVSVVLQDASGGTTTVEFDRCRAVSDTDKAADAADEVTLVCREARMVAALDANPYARFIAGATERADVDMSLMDRRTPPSAARSTPAVRGAAANTRAFRLEGARLESWSVDLNPASGTGAWTLEVRVARIEMA